MPESSTTEFIRRRIYHWKTTAAGIAGILGPIAAILFPEYSTKINAATMMLLGAGSVAAADSSNVQPKSEIVVRPPNITSALFLLAWALALGVFLTGCATSRQEITSEIKHPDGTIEHRETKSRATVFWDAKQTLEKVRLSNTPKSHSIGMSSDQQESSGTNAVDLFRAGIEGAVSGALKGAK